MATEERLDPPPGRQLSWRVKLGLLAGVMLLAFSPTIIAVTRGVPLNEAVGLVQWIFGSVCVLGGRIYWGRGGLR